MCQVPRSAPEYPNIRHCIDRTDRFHRLAEANTRSDCLRARLISPQEFNSPSRLSGLFRLVLADEGVCLETKAVLVTDEAIAARTGMIYRTGSTRLLTLRRAHEDRPLRVETSWFPNVAVKC
jgi:hypothetical protein